MTRVRSGADIPARSLEETDKKKLSVEKIEELKEYLKRDLPKLFDKGEIDRAYFEEKMNFEDPITKYDSLSGYLFNIQMLRILFRPIFELQKTYQTGPNEITTRWTMEMDFSLLPWKPKLVFTGLSIYGVNPETGRFNSHIDIWDSIKDQKYFSREGLQELLSQSSEIYGNPSAPSPKYHILVKRKDYEVRKYESFVVAEINLGQKKTIVGEKDEIFRQLAAYTKGQNSGGENLEIGSPTFLGVSGESPFCLFPRFIIGGKFSDSFPTPLNSEIKVFEVPSKILAARKFGGNPSDEEIKSNEKLLRDSVFYDDLKPSEGFFYAQYNDSNPLTFLKRNEVLISVEDFTFDSIK